MIDNYTRSALNFFAASPLDRHATKRKDEAWVAEQMQAPTTRYVPVWQSQNLLTQETLQPVMLTFDEAKEYRPITTPILLGSLDDTMYFGLSIDPKLDKASLPGSLTERGEFHDLRARWEQLDEKQDGVLVFAKAMAYWHERNQFCGDCGHPSESKEMGFMRRCTNDACKKMHFPRSDPAIIVLVQSEGRCLLGRQPTWPKGRYSVIAGFVEPSESVEDAVKREVYEESGVHVDRIYYHSSQPWPFPSSLMLGYMAEATTTEIDLVDEELEHAHWFSHADIARMVEEDELRLPPPVSISHNLIKTWFNQGDQGTLTDLLDRVGKKKW